MVEVQARWVILRTPFALQGLLVITEPLSIRRSLGLSVGCSTGTTMILLAAVFAVVQMAAFAMRSH